MKRNTTNILKFFTYHHLQRIAIAFIFLIFTISVFAEGDWSGKATVSVNKVTNTGGGSVYIDNNPQQKTSTKDINQDKTSASFDIYAKPDQNYTFAGWYSDQSGATQISTTTPHTITIGSKDDQNPNKPYYAKFLLPAPTLSCTSFGYTFASLSWNQVPGAESYNIYNGNTKVKTIEAPTTSTTIENLSYGSTYNFTIKSVDVIDNTNNESNQSEAITVICPAYPFVQNIRFSDVTQNSVTVEWDPVTITPANHSFVQYHIHFYENYAIEGTLPIEAFTTTNTSHTFSGLIDNTQYTVYVDVEYQYTLNGETKNVTPDATHWSNKSITTESFIPPQTEEGYIGELKNKGVWYYVDLYKKNNITKENYNITLKYPVEHLSFNAIAGGGTVENSIGIKEDGTKKNQTKKWLGTDGTQTFNFDISTSTSNLSLVKESGTSSDWAKLEVSNIWLEIAPHIKTKEKSVDFMFNLTDEGPGEEKNVEFHSFLATNKLECTLVNKDGSPYTDNYFELLETEKLNTITPNTLSIVDETTYNFKVKFNPDANVDGYYYARIKITDGTSTEYVDLSGYKYNLNLRWEQELPELTVDEPFELIADTYDDNGGGPIATEIYVTYEWEPEDAFSIIYPENAKEAYPIITPQRSCESVTITAYKKGNIYYNSSETIIKTIAKIKQAEQTLNWKEFGLTTADKDITITGNLCQSTKADLLNRIGETITYTSSNSNVVEINNNTLTVHKYGEAVTITASQAGKEGYINPAESKSVTITPDIGTIQFDNNGGNKNWNNSANWLPINTLNTRRNVEPSAVVNGVITAEAVISNAERNEINNLTFETGGKLTIGATSGLKANAVTNATADNLTLEASADGNATFIYNSGTPSATVEMYSKASGGVVGGTPEWQYMGVAVSGAKVKDFKYNDERNAWLLKWNEAENIINSDPWSDAPLEAETELVPWAGYSISQPTAKTYSLKGSLINKDQTYNLSYTQSDDPDCGFNLLANSYTAPIDIAKLKPNNFDKADACIILYNTGTYGDWEKGQTDETNPKGQLTVIPVESAEAITEQGLPTTIPSMQAFFVRANSSNASFTVNYSTDVAGAEYKGNQMRAPRAEKEFNVLKIMIEGENTRDRLYLLENEETSEAYDNGYEARKIFDAPRGHQMYATCEYGYASIDCSESFVGQTIGLKGDNDGEMLTITFDTERLDDYESLYLYDKATGKYVNIIAGEEYTFFGIKGADDNRFSIVTNPDDENQTPPFVVIGEELAFDKSQIDADNANIYIYDTSGRLLIMDKINPYENYNIPNMPNGIYLVSMNGYTTKIVKK